MFFDQFLNGFHVFMNLFCEIVCIFLSPACDKTLIRATEEELDGWMDGWMDGRAE